MRSLLGGCSDEPLRGMIVWGTCQAPIELDRRENQPWRGAPLVPPQSIGEYAR
jgi:hypothetical protein